MSLDADLMALLLDAVDGLPLIEKKRMFGFEALWADGRIFALAWRGRIALRIPDEKVAAKLAAISGAHGFSVEEGKTAPAGVGWINVPESFHDDPHELRRWAARAHALALDQPLPKARRRRRKSSVD